MGVMPQKDLDHNEVYRLHLVKAYLEKSGDFRKLFNALLIFTLTFAIFIAWPYLAVLHQEHSLQYDIEQNKSKLKQINKQQLLFKKPSDAIKKLNRKIEEGPVMLRDYIRSINDGSVFDYPDIHHECSQFTDPMANAPMQMQMQIQIPNVSDIEIPNPTTNTCNIADNTDRNICRINRFVEYQLCEYDQLLIGPVFKGLNELVDDGNQLFNKQRIAKQLATVSKNLNNHIADNPKFWYYFRDKARMGAELKSEVVNLWEEIQQEIKPVVIKLTEMQKRASIEKKKLKKAQGKLTELRKELKTRLTKIQSPIGNLPISLSESVLIFPVVLAIAFTWSIFVLLEQLRLRLCLSKAEGEKQSYGETLSSKELGQVAPLWLELGEHNNREIWRWLLLSVPVVTFAITLVAIAIYELGSGKSIMQQSSLGITFYGLLYILSIIGLSFCFLSIVRLKVRFNRD